MDSETNEAVRYHPRIWTRGRAIAFVVALAVPASLLVFTGSLVAVFVIYSVLLIEGVALILLLAAKVRLPMLSSVPKPAPGPAVGDDSLRVEKSWISLDDLEGKVKWAAAGSEISREDVAETVMRMVGQSDVTGVDGQISSDTELSRALGEVVYPYIDGGGSGVAKVAHRKRRVGRRRYLAELELIVSKLERGASA